MLKAFILHHQSALIRIAVTGIALMVSISGIWEYFLPTDVVAMLATVLGGYPMFKEAFEAIREKRMTMELSMSIAVLATLVVGQYSTGLVITFFVLIAELLEDLTMDNGRNVIKKLIELMPQNAMVRRDNRELPIPISDLHADDLVIVRPGERIPVDGYVRKGHSYVDQSTITGESQPVEKQDGHHVLAGTVNVSGVLEIEVAGTGRNTTFGKIIAVIEQAQQTQAPIEKTADRLAAKLVYFALAGAVLTFIVTRNVTATISALVVAGACGVAAGTPLAILACIGRTAREGIIVKGGIYLEQLAEVDIVVLDKTGTLTLGKPVVRDIACFNGISKEAVIRHMATAEQHSEHPLAAAVLELALNQGIEVEAYKTLEYIPGKGLRCLIGDMPYFVGNESLLQEMNIGLLGAGIWLNKQKEEGNTTILLSNDRELLGAMAIADTIRPEAKLAISLLKRQRIRVELLSGDHVEAVESMGKTLKVDKAMGNLSPIDKLRHIQELKSSGRKVVMVGDGVNDAPALMEAHVGMAMGAGTDIAFESANMILTTNDLRKVSTAIDIARRCMGVIRFNFWGTVAIDSVGIALAFLGYLTPMAAALIHVGSEMFFILNSARLFRKSGRT